VVGVGGLFRAGSCPNLSEQAAFHLSETPLRCYH